jgi:diguanylate cyclase (GGDEF)-like protein
MPDNAVVVQPEIEESQMAVSFAGTSGRLQFILLQTLVTIVLCYQLLFSRESVVSSEVKEFIVLGLLLFIAGMMVLPARMWGRSWPVVALVLGDTAITTAIIYLSGNAGSSLYLIYFLVMLIGALAPSLKQMIGLSVILCAAYGALLYLDSLETGSLSEGRLLGIPVLLVLAVFYGVTTEAVRWERQKRAGLLEQINTLKRTEVELQAQSGRDWLTGLANRRRFDEMIQQEWGRAKRDETALGVLMIDIDYFKPYNDTYGHQAGDTCLQQVAKSFSEVVHRPGDMLARYGGEEFVVVLPRTDVAGAAEVAEKIRAQVEALRIPHTNSLVSDLVTISVGVTAMVPTEKSKPAVLVAAADQALYQAKHEGRNRVRVHGDGQAGATK